MTRLGDAIFATKSAMARPFRIGSRFVLWTSGGLGFGNFLYLWLRAHNEQSAGRNFRVLLTEPMRPWVERFPAVRELVLERSEVRAFDKRDWSSADLSQRFGADYTRDQLYSFITSRILDAPVMQDLPDPGTVVNVRRGDYYSVPEFRSLYSMDLVRYTAEALELTGADRVTVVSDDPEWCREHLDLPSPVFAIADPVENFRLVCGASTLVGTNSTFSYWGGYIGDIVRTPHTVVMPAFHSRRSAYPADQLDPLWSVIEQNQRN